MYFLIFGLYRTWEGSDSSKRMWGGTRSFSTPGETPCSIFEKKNYFLIFGFEFLPPPKTIRKHPHNTPKHIPSHPPKSETSTPTGPGIEPGTLGSGVRESTHWAIPGPVHSPQGIPILQSKLFFPQNNYPSLRTKIFL